MAENPTDRVVSEAGIKELPVEDDTEEVSTTA
jgi:hypothetical protein